MMLDIAHKLQNPLTIIKSEIQLLLKGVPQKTELLFFEKTIDDVSAFIYDLLRLAKIEMAPHFLHREPQNLSNELLGLVEYFDIVAKQRNIKLQHSIESDIILNYHKESLIELVTNLVSNAVKYIGKAETNQTKTISISLVKQADSVILSVSDNGIGIPAKDLPHIFERFYRTNSQEHTAIGGTGLGLAICKKIVEIHNGTIEVASENLNGSTFTVRFNTQEKPYVSRGTTNLVSCEM